MSCVLKHEIPVKEIQDIWRQIVIDFAITNNSFQTINTFAIVDTKTDSKHAALGKTYRDYLKGEFWARDWVLSGANPNEVKKNYPILMLESWTFKATEIKTNSRITGCQQFKINIEDLIECESCNDEEQRTGNQVSCDVSDMLLFGFMEFLTYAKYKVANGTGFEYVWWSKGKYEKELAAGTIIDETNLSIEALLDLKTLPEIKKWGKEYDIKRGACLDFSICGCVKEKPDFEYDKQVDKYEGTTKCSCC